MARLNGSAGHISANLSHLTLQVVGFFEKLVAVVQPQAQNKVYVALKNICLRQLKLQESGRRKCWC